MLAGAVWGHKWKGMNVMSRCDNASGGGHHKCDCRESDSMHLMRCLTFLKAKFHFELYASHIRGSDNVLVDALSRDNLHYFMSHHPQARQAPTYLQPELLDVTIITRSDWTSRRRNIFAQV